MDSQLESAYLSQTSLTDQLSSSLNSEADLKSQISWEKLQYKNQIESLERQLEGKDRKIKQLKTEAEVNVRLVRISFQVTMSFQAGVTKLQAKVQQIYIQNSNDIEEKMHEVSRRARSPIGIRRRPRNIGIRGMKRLMIMNSFLDKSAKSEASDDSFESFSSIFSSLTDEREIQGVSSQPSSIGKIESSNSVKQEENQLRRSKLFRHHVRLDSSKISKDNSPSSTTLYSFSAPPEKLRLGRSTTLPVDYRSSVATLPLIQAKQKESEREQTLAVQNLLDSESERRFLKEPS